MKNRHNVAVFFLFTFIVAVFFYKTFFWGLIPFPGDILLSEYKPWQSYSFSGFLPGTVPNKAQYPDTIRQLYPWRTEVTSELKAGKFPLWNPYNFSGAPLFANFQSAVFYPLNILYLVLPQTIAWSALIILQPFLALLFTYWYLRKTGCSARGAFLGSTSYALSLFATVWLEYNTVGHVMLWLPLCLIALEHLQQTSSAGWFGLLLFGLVSSVLAGHPQLAAYLFMFVFCYAWFRAKRVLGLTALAVFLSLAISSVQLLPGAELALFAARSPHDFPFIYQKILIQPMQLLMAVIPNLFGNPATRTYWPQDTFVGKTLYIGLVPLFFLLAALRVKSQLVKFFGTAVLVVVVLMTANPVTYILYKLNIPIISASSPTLMGFLFTFSLASLCAFGLDEWTREKHSIGKLIHRSMSVIIFFAVVWLLSKTTAHTAIAQKALLYSGAVAFITLTGFFLAITRKKLMIPVVTLLIVLNAADLFFQFQKFNPFVPASFVFPETSIFQFIKNTAGIDRFWGYGSASIQANFASQYRIFSPDGYDPLYPKWYGEFIHASNNGRLLTQFTTATRSDAIITPGFGELDLSSNPYRLRVLDTIGVKYVFDRPENGSTQKTFLPDRFTLRGNVDGWTVYENKRAIPRIFLTDDYRTYANQQQFNDIFFAETFIPSKTILLTEHVDGTLRSPEHTSVQILSYQPSSVALTVTSTGNLLFLSDTYYPGWQAFIDGAETKIYRADHAFRAVYVPEGTHTVRFTFFPLSFKIGLIITMISLAITVIVITHLRRRS